MLALGESDFQTFVRCWDATYPNPPSSPQLWKKFNTIWEKLLQVSRSGVQSSAAGGLALHEVFAPKLPKAAAKPKAKQVDSQQANKAWGGLTMTSSRI